MSTIVYVKFDNDADAARGLHEVSAHSRVSGYRGGVWAVRREELKRLDDLKLSYRLATDEEVEAALAAVRHPVTPVL